jgi:hypothetical protein
MDQLGGGKAKTHRGIFPGGQETGTGRITRGLHYGPYGRYGPSAYKLTISASPPRRRIPGHPGQSPSRAHDLFRVSVTIVTLTRNKSLAADRYDGQTRHSGRLGGTDGRQNRGTYHTESPRARLTERSREPHPRHGGRGRPPHPSLPLPSCASRPLSQIACSVMGMREAGKDVDHGPKLPSQRENNGKPHAGPTEREIRDPE